MKRLLILAVLVMIMAGCSTRDEVPPPPQTAMVPEQPVRPGGPEQYFPGIRVNPYNPYEPVTHVQPMPGCNNALWRDMPECE